MSGMKRVIVGGVAYVIRETDRSIEQVVQDIEDALTQGTLVKIPVLSGDEPAILYLHGGRADAVVLDPGMGPRPGEIGP